MDTRKKLYWFILALCLAGYGWLSYDFFFGGDSDNFTVCPVKTLTGIPCPSCGTTRSVGLILHGHFTEAMLTNPFGLLASLFLVIAPLWIISDLFFERGSFLVAYQKTEVIVRKQIVYLPLILLCLLNWYWNIIKGL